LVNNEFGTRIFTQFTANRLAFTILN